MMEYLDAILENTGALVAFWFLMLGIFSAVMVAAMFIGIAVRAAWHWLSRASWSSVIVSAERKAFRG